LNSLTVPLMNLTKALLTHDLLLFGKSSLSLSMAKSMSSLLIASTQ